MIVSKERWNNQINRAQLKGSCVFQCQHVYLTSEKSLVHNWEETQLEGDHKLMFNPCSSSQEVDKWKACIWSKNISHAEYAKNKGWLYVIDTRIFLFIQQ